MPKRGAIYLCPQSLSKFHPEFDRILGAILKRDRRGRLVLIEGRNENWTRLLRDRFRRTAGLDSDRITFLAPQDHEDFLNLMAVSDVMLDPIHFGGGNTNYEALAMGLPVVTLPFDLMRGRVACGLYHKMDVPDCVTRTAEEYVETAVHLGTDRDFRRYVSGRIAESAQAVFDDTESIRQLEQFLLQATSECRCIGRTARPDRREGRGKRRATVRRKPACYGMNPNVGYPLPGVALMG